MTKIVEMTKTERRVGWRTGLLSLMIVLFLSVFLPATVVVLFGGSAGTGGNCRYGR